MVNQEQSYLTISNLTKYLKRKFDNDPHLAKVFVMGEVSNFRYRANTHQYFSLKDEHAKIKAICFKSAFAKLGFMPEEGMKVFAIGHISLYEATGEYQMYINHMEVAGAGLLFQAYKQLKEKLTQEGLFSKSKRAIVKFPKRIALVTSQSGAVLHDIQTTIKRRYPIVELVVYPTVVQGKESAASIVKNLNRIKEHADQYDTVIIARGGGSIEDLWSFNEEIVVRAIYDMPIPVISSIGHETDTTLSDFVADLRAATPTAAAELAVPVLNDILIYLDEITHRLTRQMTNKITIQKQQLTKINQSYIFKQPERLYDSYLQKLDYATNSLMKATEAIMVNKKQLEQTLFYQLERNHPGHLMQQYAQHLIQQEQLLKQHMQNHLKQKETQFILMLQKLELLSPLKNMLRGYSYVTVNNQIIKTIQDVKLDDTVAIQLMDGQLEATVTKINQEERD